MIRFKGSATNLHCFRSFLATNLSITIPSNISLTNNIVLSSPRSPSFERSVELAAVGRTLDIIIGDGNCFFRAMSKESTISSTFVTDCSQFYTSQ